MKYQKLVPVLLGVIFTLTLSLSFAHASKERPRTVHPLTGQAPDMTYVVTKTSDSGDDTNAAPGSFRRALLDARQHPGFDLIVFDLSGSGVKTITLNQYLPISTDDAGVMIDGTQSDDRIELDFSRTSGHFGLHFMSDNNVIKGLTLNNLRDAAAIALENGNNNLIIGNKIGTDPTGKNRKPNHSAIMLKNAHNNQIGGTEGVTPGGACTGDCNLLSGNDFHGIVLTDRSRNNRIVGNYIGTNNNGNAILENKEDGILISEGSNTVVGGPTPEERNIISGNRVIGIEIALQNSFNNLVQGNYIGINSAGTGVLATEGTGIFVGLNAHDNVLDGNVIGGQRHFGILLFDNARKNEMKNNRIGISPFDDSNFGNRQKGIEIQGSDNNVHHNRIAFNSDGVRIKSGMNNRISQNELFDNRTFGINIGADAYTANDPGDGDSGANGLQNFPTLNSAEALNGNLTIRGTLNSRPNASFTIELFHNPMCDLTFTHPVGEGKNYLGSVNVNTDGGGNGSFTTTINSAPGTGVVTATATDSKNNTSEFSECRGIVIQDTPPSKPNLISPIDGAPVANPPLLDWSPSDGAKRYIVKIVDGAPGGPKVHLKRGVKTDQYVPPVLESGKTYFWFVKACKTKHLCSRSDWQSFTIP